MTSSPSSGDLNLDTLPSDIIRKITLVGHETIDVMRLVRITVVASYRIHGVSPETSGIMQTFRSHYRVVWFCETRDCPLQITPRWNSFVAEHLSFRNRLPAIEEVRWCLYEFSDVLTLRLRCANFNMTYFGAKFWSSTESNLDEVIIQRRNWLNTLPYRHSKSVQSEYSHFKKIMSLKWIRQSRIFSVHRQ